MRIPVGKIKTVVKALGQNLRAVKGLLNTGENDRALALVIESIGICLDFEELVGVDDLTPSESKVRDGVILGFSNREIAETLGIDERSVKFHLGNVFKKMGLKTRAALIVEHYKHALGTLEQDKRILQQEIEKLSHGSDRGCAELSNSPVSGGVQ